MKLNQYANLIFLFVFATAVFLFALSRRTRQKFPWGLRLHEYPIFWIASLIALLIRWRPAPWLYRLGNKLPGCLFVPAGETHRMKGEERLVFGQIDGTLSTSGYVLRFAGTLAVSGTVVVDRSATDIFGDGSPGVISGTTASLTKDKNYENIEADSIEDLMNKVGYGGGGSAGGGYVPLAFSAAGGVGGTSPPPRIVCAKCDRTMLEVPVRLRKSADGVFTAYYCGFCDPDRLKKLEAEVPRPKICIERNGEKFWLVLLEHVGGGPEEPPARGDYLDDYAWYEPTVEELWRGIDALNPNATKGHAGAAPTR